MGNRRTKGLRVRDTGLHTVAGKKHKDRGDNPVRSVGAVGEYVDTAVYHAQESAEEALFKNNGPHVSWYMAGKTVKKRQIEVADAEYVWILEYFHETHKKWLYLDRGKGVPFGPWKMERAIQEMV